MEGTYANIDEFIKKTSINFGTALTVYAWVTPQGGVKTFKYFFACGRIISMNDGIYILNNVATLYMTADFWSEHDKVEDGYVEVNITGLANYPFTDIPAVVDEDRVTMLTPYPDAPSFTNFTGIAVGGKYTVTATITAAGGVPTRNNHYNNVEVQAINVASDVVTLVFNINLFPAGDTIADGSIQSNSPRGLNFVQVEKSLTDPEHQRLPLQLPILLRRVAGCARV
jgi:hypothetical protein